ncbi:uncharacterized protein EAE98_004895 [Botrytis deweyae]|uniref:Saposin B-type domain-containing protein n=1 Tax=Botrytis deweyae TaxID=2478750 RepID=A0ABQ7IPM3_9HELO|nr:uncharacterized protein EAE98_004895 [Botrytis deweyae]KAF7930495.1 hypothetical protein EAE98_004895 [Botrytis deweyae]
MAGICLDYAASRVSSDAKICCYYAVCTPREDWAVDKSPSTCLMSFEERCINFQLILAKLIELSYANVRTFELCKALDHCESYTIAYIRRKGAKKQDMRSTDKKKAAGRT